MVGMVMQAHRKVNAKSAKRHNPRTAAAKPGFNARKSCVNVLAQLEPGDDAAELKALVAEYYREFQPESQSEASLVDTMIAADVELKRLRMEETQLWRREMADGSDVAQAYSRSYRELERIWNKTEAVEIKYIKRLEQMRRILRQIPRSNVPEISNLAGSEPPAQTN